MQVPIDYNFCIFFYDSEFFLFLLREESFGSQFLYKNPKSIPEVQFRIDCLQLPVLSKTLYFLTFENFETFLYFSLELLLELSTNKLILLILGILSS